MTNEIRQAFETLDSFTFKVKGLEGTLFKVETWALELPEHSYRTVTAYSILKEGRLYKEGSMHIGKVTNKHLHVYDFSIFNEYIVQKIALDRIYELEEVEQVCISSKMEMYVWQ